MASCSSALLGLLLNDTEKAVKAWDAFGKMPAGVMTGNMAWIGAYDECVELSGMHHCMAKVNANLSAIAGYQMVLPIDWGVCVPQECSAKDIADSFTDIISVIPGMSWLSLGGNPTGNPINNPDPVVCETVPPRPYDAGFIIFTTFFIALFALMLVGSFLDVFLTRQIDEQPDDTNPTSRNTSPASSAANEHTPLIGATGTVALQKNNRVTATNRIQDLILCFAVNRNLCKLLDTKQSDNTIGCLNGIRVISIAWVILGHTYVYVMYAGAVDNSIKIFDIVEEFPFQAVSNAFFSVDTFFFLSGFLLCYVGLPRLGKASQKLSTWGWFYFHRFWRLTPLYAAVILFFIYYCPFFGDGPLWQTAVIQSTTCTKYWWRNQLYINNFFPLDELCLNWSWYLSVDTQCFVVSSLIIMALISSAKAGLVLLAVMLLASLTVTGVLIGYYDLIPNVLGILFGNMPGGSLPGIDPRVSEHSYMELVYFKPYCRIVPYLVGLLMGYAMHKHSGRRRHMSKKVVILGWSLSSIIGLAVVYGTYWSFQNRWSTAVNVLYGTFSRLGWSLAIGWVIYACKNGFGGWINSFLSWTFWIPLSRLTFAAYLLQGIVIQIFYMNFTTPIHLSTDLFSFYFCGFLLLSYGGALLFSLAIEYPCANLEKMLMASSNKTGSPKRDIDGVDHNSKQNSV